MPTLLWLTIFVSSWCWNKEPLTWSLNTNWLLTDASAAAAAWPWLSFSVWAYLLGLLLNFSQAPIELRESLPQSCTRPQGIPEFLGPLHRLFVVLGGWRFWKLTEWGHWGGGGRNDWTVNITELQNMGRGGGSTTGSSSVLSYILLGHQHKTSSFLPEVVKQEMCGLKMYFLPCTHHL